MFRVTYHTRSRTRIATSAAEKAWQDDMEGWRVLMDEATSDEKRAAYERLLRRSQSYRSQHLEQLKGAMEGKKLDVDYEF
jgi:hypothetical protein